MHRPPKTHPVSTYENLLISSSNDVAVYRLLKKLEQKKFYLLRKANRYQHLVDEASEELKHIDNAMESLREKVK